MRLSFKIILSFILIILMLALANIFSTSYVLENLHEERLKTSEVLLARSLANRLYRAVIEANAPYITDILFDEKSLREEKVEYILIFDEKGYLLAHTYLASFPKQLLKLDNSFRGKDEYRLEAVKGRDVSVYDIAVPIMEGIKQVGTIHLGIKTEYAQHLISLTKTTSTLITFIISILAVVVALILSRTITNPTLELKELAQQISGGNLNKRIEIRSNDEIGDLARTFNLMTEELKKSQDQLIQSEKLSAMGLLAAGLAHEINSPLSGLASLVKKYRNRAVQGSEEYEHMTLMSRACEHMAKIVKDFGSLSRKSRGRLVNIDVNDIIDSTLSFISGQLVVRGITVNKNFSEGLAAVRGNKTGLQQVVLNLISNARDAMPGGGRLDISTGMSGDGRGVVMKFVDTGTGISRKYLGSIFDPFFTTKAHGEGVGLGLSVVYGIIKNHGGEIKVESEPGKGTVMSVYLPVADEKEEGQKDERGSNFSGR